MLPSSVVLNFPPVAFTCGSWYFIVKTAMMPLFLAKDAAWLQGRKKNCVKLRSDRKAPNNRKPPKEIILGVARCY